MSVHARGDGGQKRERSILYRKVRKSFIVEITFELSLERDEFL